MKIIQLTQKQVALIDDVDFENVRQFVWYANRNNRGKYYARRKWTEGGKEKSQYLHQFLFPGPGRVDHKDGDGLNCQRENLRPATHQQNNWNMAKQKTVLSSRFKGVCWHKIAKRWISGISLNNRSIYLGLFDLEEDAAIAYNGAAKLFFGDFARLNIV